MGTNFVILMRQDMGLRYFDRVVVVSAGRFTEMEAMWDRCGVHAGLGVMV